MGRDDSWPATVPSVVPCYGTVCRRKRPQNTQNGGTVLPTANLMADSESRSPVFYSSFLVTIRLSHQVSEIFVRDRQTDRRTTQAITTAGLHTVAGQLQNTVQQLLSGTTKHIAYSNNIQLIRTLKQADACNACLHRIHKHNTLQYEFSNGISWNKECRQLTINQFNTNCITSIATAICPI